MQRCEVRLVGTDGSKLDDRRFFSATIDQGIPIAIVKPSNHEIPYLEDSFYLHRALAPARSENWALQTTMLTADELISEPLSPYTAVFCVNLPTPDADTATRLRQYVEQGGNLIWIAGENVDPAAYSMMDEEAGKSLSLLPAPLLDIRTAEADDERDSWHVASLNTEHPALRLFVEPASLYTSILVYKHVRVDENAGADGSSGASEVLMRLDDGSPLLLSRRVERGRVLFLGTSVHVGWTNLPLRPIFLPLWAQLTFEMAGVEQAKHRVIAGAPLALSFVDQISPISVEVLTPGGATIRRNTEDLEGGGQVFRFPETHDIGIYRLRPLEGTVKTKSPFPSTSIPTKRSRSPLAAKNSKNGLLRIRFFLPKIRTICPLRSKNSRGQEPLERFSRLRFGLPGFRNTRQQPDEFEGRGRPDARHSAGNASAGEKRLTKRFLRPKQPNEIGHRSSSCDFTAAPSSCVAWLLR